MLRLCRARNKPKVKVVFPLPDDAAPMRNCGLDMVCSFFNRMQI